MDQLDKYHSSIKIRPQGFSSLGNDMSLSHGMGTKEQRWKVPSLFWLPVIFCAVLLFVVDVFQSQYTMLQTRIQTDDFLMYQKSLKGFLIKTPGCRIPEMDPFDHTITKFILTEKKPVCNSGIPPLVDSNLTSIFRVNSSLAQYRKHDLDSVQCCYRPFYRVEPRQKESDNKFKFDKRCTAFNESANITDEFIKVTCTIGNATIYTDFFSFVPLKIKKAVFKQKPLNVLVIGIDAVSRLNFHRQMPTTVEYLKNISAIELLGYNKVHDNTYPNLIPVLTGLTDKEMEKSCWTKDNNHYDNCSFIWKDYKKRGYVTAFGEDSTWMGVFNYNRQGFIKQPTDYMWGTFNRVSEKQIGNSHRMNVEECVGSRQVYQVFLGYIKNFVTTMSMEGLPYFAFFWGASLSHDFLNKPKLGDLDYYKMLKNFQENGYLNNTVMVVMSDHGIRWGDIRQTYQGRMEERLPFVFMVLPEWYNRQYKAAYSNLLRNTRRLTTPFDLHETLKDLLHPFNLTHNHQNFSRGYSLFSIIPPERTCEDAAISSHWCTCQQSVEIDKDDALVIEAAHFAVDYINHELEGYAECSNLSLYNISNARIMTHGDHILNGTGVKDYTIVLHTIPGNGIFEVTLRYDKTNTFEVMGTISRLNLYGKQSACITDFHLKLYCYCKSIFNNL